MSEIHGQDQPDEIVIEVVENIVYETGMQPVAPNPFNPTTQIRFTLKDPEQVVISIYDIRGRKVVDLVDGVYSRGPHSVTWHSKNQQGQQVASGVYFARLKVGEDRFTRRMLLVK